MATDYEQSSKVTRSRERMRAAGLRPVQFWVPDTRLASFAADLRRQCLELNGAPSEAEVLGFSEEAAGQFRVGRDAARGPGRGIASR
ncbi:MAG: hypothetical protein RL342_2170 [Pseudomonadota bacterium]